MELALRKTHQIIERRDDKIYGWLMSQEFKDWLSRQLEELRRPRRKLL